MMRKHQNYDENDEIDLSKSEINAERILKRIHVHDLDSGGVFSLITGCQGSGKTSVMLSFMDYTLQHYPDEKVFWSNTYNAPFQFNKLGMDKCHIMVKEGSNVSFHDRNQKLKEIHPKVTTFKDFDDCYNKAKPGYCNAVFFGEVYSRKDMIFNRFSWMDFIHYLRSAGEWVHVYIDELSEIAPQFMAGEIFHKIGRFGIDLKEVRKCMINVHTNSQAISDIDPRCRGKAFIRIFLPGAKHGDESRISQRAIDNLDENNRIGNQGYLEMSGKFGRTRFTDIYKPDPKIQWEAHAHEK
jgi:hypothetical protein